MDGALDAKMDGETPKQTTELLLATCPSVSSAVVRCHWLSSNAPARVGDGCSWFCGGITTDTSGLNGQSQDAERLSV